MESPGIHQSLTLPINIIFGRYWSYTNKSDFIVIIIITIITIITIRDFPANMGCKQQ